MKISECKKQKVLPKKHQKVITKMRPGISFPIVKSGYIERRRNAPGYYMDCLAGSSGDFWWIDHGFLGVALYATEEVFDCTAEEYAAWEERNEGHYHYD